MRITSVLVGLLMIAMSAQSQQTRKADSFALGKSEQVIAPASDRKDTYSRSRTWNQRMMAAELLAQNGDFGDATVLFEDVLKHHPNLAEAHYDLGLAMLGSGNNPQRWPKAMEQFRAALRVRPNYPEARNLLGVGMLVDGNPAGSIKELEIAAHEAPGMAEIHLNLGKAFAGAGKWRDATSEFRKAIKLRHSYPEAEAELGSALFNEGKASAAESAFRNALRGNPDIEIARYGFARTLRAEGKGGKAQVEFKEARALLQRKSDATMSSNLSNQSLSLARQGKAVEAAHMAERAVKLEPDNWVAIYNYGLLLADTGNLRGGIDEIRNAISLMPLRRAMYLTMAKMQEQMGETEAAACTLKRVSDLLELATAHDGQSADNWETEKCRARKGKFPFGASFGNLAKHRAFANYLSAKGDLLGASGELLYSTKLAPSNPDVRYSLGVVWLQMGSLKDANLELRTVLFLSPRSPKVHFALGTVLVEEKQYKAAERQFREALQLDPKDREAQRMLAEIAGQETR